MSSMGMLLSTGRKWLYRDAGIATVFLPRYSRLPTTTLLTLLAVVVLVDLALFLLDIVVGPGL